MKVMVAGAAGMLGQDVVGAAQRRGHDVGGLAHHDLDITDPVSIDAALAELRPEAIIDCAAWSAVDGAEDDERGARRSTTPGRGCSPPPPPGSARAPLPVQRLRLRRHQADPVPRGRHAGADHAYGRSKLGGEVSVAAANPKHFIVRTSWLYGLGGGNFVETMLRIGRAQPVLVVSDQRGCPTSTADLAEGMFELIASDRHGIHHMVGGGDCTWFEFATEIFDQAHYETRVMSATTEMMARKAPRPAYSILGHSREDAILLQPWQHALRRYLDDRELIAR